MSRRPPLPRPLTLGVLLENATDPMPGTGCRRWAGCTDSNGYGTIKYWGRTFRVPRLVMLMSYGLGIAEYDTVPARLHTRHQCDDPLCIEPDHLLIGTAKQNADDARRHRAERAADRLSTPADTSPLRPRDERRASTNAGDQRSAVRYESDRTSATNTRPALTTPSDRTTRHG